MSSTPQVRVLIVEDHQIVADGLTALLNDQKDMTVVGQVGSVAESAAKAAELQPDVVVLDINLPDLNGLEVTRRLKAVSSAAEILLVTEHGDAMTEEAFRAGARGYLLKSDSGEELAVAIRTVGEKRKYISARFASGSPGPHKA